MSIIAQLDLDDRHKAFVRLITTEGLGATEAAERSGFHRDMGYRLLRKPAVVHAIHEALQFELQTVLAPLAFRVAASILRNEKASERVRADISFKFMDRAGFIAPTSKDAAPQKALSEMNREELLRFIDANQAAIDKVEAELAERATEVGSPHPAPKTLELEAKALSFLD